MARKHRHLKQRKPRLHRRSKPGAAPGTVQGIPGSPTTVIQVMAYGGDQLVEQTVRQVAQIQEFLGHFPVCWVNVDGLENVRIIHELGDLFGLHSLALEDVVNVHQRSKVDPYPEHLFIVARMISLGQGVQDEQISLFVGRNFVVSFQHLPGDCLDPLRQRLRKGGGHVRAAGTDFLAYSILDAVIDSYFPIVDTFADRLDELEEAISIERPSDALDGIHHVRNQLLVLRRNIRPHRDAINELIRDDHPVISDETRVFLRDCYDHTIQLIDLLEIYREMCGDLRDYYLSLASNRLNEIMKVLTMIATLFMPLSFIAGVYGMNFDTRFQWNMPELRWRYGYITALSGMLAVAVGFLVFFVRKGWICSARAKPPTEAPILEHRP